MTIVVAKLLRKHGPHFGGIGHYELNGASATQLMCCRGTLVTDSDSFNVTTGSISMGHPFGTVGEQEKVDVKRWLGAVGNTSSGNRP